MSLSSEVDQFVLDEIDSVPHLEALLLLWESRPKAWGVEELGKRLYIVPEVAKAILDDLARQQLILGVGGPPFQYRYESKAEGRDSLLTALETTYRRETVRISTMIHSKASASVREFARAFRIKKERS